MVSIQSGPSHVNLTSSIHRWHCCGLLCKTWTCLVIQTSSAKRPFHCAVSDQVCGVIVSWQASGPTVFKHRFWCQHCFISDFHFCFWWHKQLRANRSVCFLALGPYWCPQSAFTFASKVAAFIRWDVHSKYLVFQSTWCCVPRYIDWELFVGLVYYYQQWWMKITVIAFNIELCNSHILYVCILLAVWKFIVKCNILTYFMIREITFIWYGVIVGAVDWLNFVPFAVLGYRSVQLKNGYSEEMELTSLLVHIDIRNPKARYLQSLG